MPSKNEILWEQLAPESLVDGCSDWKTIEDIKAVGINWSNNGNQRHSKFLGLVKYVWENKKKKNKIVGIRTIGYDQNIKAAQLLKNRPISNYILKHCHNKCCVACGSNKNMVADHKNDLYDDPRVHNKTTQRLSDFQALCNNCNIRKSAVCKKTKKTGKRQPAPYYYTSLGFPKFYEGDDTFDEELGLKGTYWYDVEAYKDHCRMLITLS